jgi:ribose transport system ATP-binding protein
VSDTSATEIKIINLTKTFGDSRALNDVNLTIKPGEVHCLLGQNGSGKSTLIKVLSGYHLPDPGSQVMIAGHQLLYGAPQDAAGLGLRFVHQQRALVGQLSAVENMAIGAGFKRTAFGSIDWHAQIGHTRSLLALLGLSGIDVHAPVGRLRAIDRTAVALARALDPFAGEIKFLFLDEPTATLPPHEVHLLFQLLEQVVAQGVGVVYVTHRLDEVFQIGRSVSVLRDGIHQCTRTVGELSQAELIKEIVGGDQATYDAGTATANRARRIGPPTMEVCNLSSRNLREVSFTVRKGEILGFAGLTGSGREEIAYAAFGAIPTSCEQIKVDGREAKLPLTPIRAIHVGLALVPSNTAAGSAVHKFTVRENVSLPMVDKYTIFGKISRRRETAQTLRWIQDLRIDRGHRSTAHIGYSELSGGNQQKVILAKWLNASPSVLLCDEPTAGVDVGARTAMYDLMTQYAERGASFVLASSDMSDHLHVCDRVLVLREGQVTEELVGAEITESRLLAAISGGDEGDTSLAVEEASTHGN